MVSSLSVVMAMEVARMVLVVAMASMVLVVAMARVAKLDILPSCLFRIRLQSLAKTGIVQAAAQEVLEAFASIMGKSLSMDAPKLMGAGFAGTQTTRKVNMCEITQF